MNITPNNHTNNRFRSLCLHDKTTVLHLWLMMVIVDIRLRLLPHRWNSRLLYPNSGYHDSGNSTPPEPEDRAKEKIARLVHLISVAAGCSLIFNMSCLRRSLVLRSRLRFLGIPARLVFGMGKINNNSEMNGKFSAHAWLEAGSLIIDSSSDPSKFSRFS